MEREVLLGSTHAHCPLRNWGGTVVFTSLTPHLPCGFSWAALVCSSFLCHESDSGVDTSCLLCTWALVRWTPWHRLQQQILMWLRMFFVCNVIFRTSGPSPHCTHCPFFIKQSLGFCAFFGSDECHCFRLYFKIWSHSLDKAFFSSSSYFYISTFWRRRIRPWEGGGFYSLLP